MGLSNALSFPLKKISQVIKWSTIRDFGGGWNVIDNDLNLSSRFAVVLTNMFRGADGSLQVRWGTRRHSQTNLAEAVVVNFTTDVTTITTVAASTSVTLTLVSSKQFLRGQRIRIANVTGTYDTIIPSNINGDRLITAVATNGTTLTVTMGAAAGAGAGPTALADGDYSKGATTNNSNVVAMHYFDNHLVTVHADGSISKVDSVGQAEAIWNTDIASTMPGAPAAWVATTWASFATFGGLGSGTPVVFTAPKLVVTDGTNKPVVIDLANSVFAYCQYLVDSAGSNANVPIARYVESMPEFLVMAGDPTYPAAILISDQRNLTAWTLGSGAVTATPGISTALDLVHYVNVSDPTIRGLRRFQDQLVVTFDEATVLVTITIVSSVISAAVTKVISKQGAIAHNSVVSIGDDLLMSDVVGVPSLQQALFSGGIRAERASELIDPEIQTLVKDLSVGESGDRIFAVFNQLESQYMLFIPNDGLTETLGFIYTKIDTLRVKAWSKFEGMNWRCGASSALGRVFLAEDKDIFLYGTDFDPIYSDKELTGAQTGDDIVFTWELPWADFDERTLTKHNRYLSMDTIGGAPFTVEMFVNNITLTGVGAGLNNPMLTMDFTAGSGGGYGFGPQAYGGARRTSDERLWAWQTKFKIAKLRFSGSSKKEMRFIAVSLGYSLGSIRP